MKDAYTNSLQIARCIHVIGNSCAGKSTLAEILADSLGSTFIDLDALNWLPHWVGLNASDPAELNRRILEATAGDAWVVAGSYIGFSQAAFWSKLDTVIWLDLPRHLLVRRMLKRSWCRWRSQELLWGTNTERFWPQLAVWRKSDSLLWWILTQHERKREQMQAYIKDERWQHIRFVRLSSPEEVGRLIAQVEREQKA